MLSTVRASPDGHVPGLVEGTVPKTGNRGAYHAEHLRPRRQHRSHGADLPAGAAGQAAR